MKPRMKPTHIALIFLTGNLLLQGTHCLAEPAATTGPVLGRLFLSPEWRVALERQRQLNQQQARKIEGDAVRLDGVVTRSSGKSTVWINGKPQSESSSESGISAAVSPRQPGRAIVSAGAEPPVNLKVGVTLNQATGETSGGLANGEIRVRPAREK